MNVLCVAVPRILTAMPVPLSSPAWTSLSGASA